MPVPFVWGEGCPCYFCYSMGLVYAELGNFPSPPSGPSTFAFGSHGLRGPATVGAGCGTLLALCWP